MGFRSKRHVEKADAPWSVDFRGMEHREKLRFEASKTAFRKNLYNILKRFELLVLKIFVKFFSCKKMLSGQISTKQSQHGFRRQLLHATAKTSAIIWLFAGFFVPLHAQYQKASLPEPT